MLKITQTTITEQSVNIRLSNGICLYIAPNNDYFYFSLSRVEVPTQVNPDMGDKGCTSNNTLRWAYTKIGEE